MKKIYKEPKEIVIELGATERLLQDSGGDTGGYGNGGDSKPGDDGDGMDEDTPSRSQLQWDNKW